MEREENLISKHLGETNERTGPKHKNAKAGSTGRPRHFSALLPYIIPVFMLAGLSLLIYPLQTYLGTVNIAMLFLLPVLFSATRWGKAPAITSAAMGVITFNFFFIPPFYTFSVYDIRYLISFVLFMLTGLITGTLSGQLKRQINYSRQRENHVSNLYSLSKDIAAVDNLENILAIITRKITDTLEGQVVLLLPNERGQLVLRQSSGPENFLNESELAVATWVYKKGQKAGRGTETLGTAAALYLPLRTEQDIHGVLGISFNQIEIQFNTERLRLLEAFAGLSAMAINKIRLAEEAREAHTLAESERLRTALFNSLSHDLRTPLASIIGAVTGLLEDENSVYSPDARLDLLHTIFQGAERMNRFVNNLLDMARLESGMLKLSRNWCDIQDIIGVALNRLGESLNGHPLEIAVQPDLPLIQADYVLIEQVLINLLDNAQKYSKPNSRIAISALGRDTHLEIAVANQGNAIPEGELSKVFDKFYRLNSPLQVSGTGLGLAICKGIIEAHSGKIWAENNELGGVTITFTLPTEQEAKFEIASPQLPFK